MKPRTQDRMQELWRGTPLMTPAARISTSATAATGFARADGSNMEMILRTMRNWTALQPARAGTTAAGLSARDTSSLVHLRLMSSGHHMTWMWAVHPSGPGAPTAAVRSLRRGGIIPPTGPPPGITAPKVPSGLRRAGHPTSPGAHPWHRGLPRRGARLPHPAAPRAVKFMAVA